MEKPAGLIDKASRFFYGIAGVTRHDRKRAVGGDRPYWVQRLQRSQAKKGA